jgi:hypothetical protein
VSQSAARNGYLGVLTRPLQMSVAPRIQKRCDRYNPRDRDCRRLRADVGLAIDSLALPDESPARWRTLYDDLIQDYQPATRSQLELVEQLTVASIDQHRAVEARMSLLAEKVRTAEFRFDQQQEAAVETFRALLPINAPAALAGLNQTAAGMRYQIRRWERLGAILEAHGTLHGQDRDELTMLLGAKAGRENLAASETAFVAWLYCLVGDDDAKNVDLGVLGTAQYQPQAFHDHDCRLWIPFPRHCRILLAELVARELARLRPREEWLRVNIEEPARAAARVQARVLTGKERDLLASERHCDQAFHRAYQALERCRRPEPASRSRARLAGVAAEPPAGAPRAALIGTPIPAAGRADNEVLDYHATRRAVLAEVGRNPDV